MLYLIIAASFVHKNILRLHRRINNDALPQPAHQQQSRLTVYRV